MKCKHCNNARFISAQHLRRYVIVDENGDILHHYPHCGEDSIADETVPASGLFTCTCCGAVYERLDDDATCDGPDKDWCFDDDIEFLLMRESNGIVPLSSTGEKVMRHVRVYRNKYYTLRITEWSGGSAFVDVSVNRDSAPRFLPEIAVYNCPVPNGRDIPDKPCIQTTSFGALTLEEYYELQRMMNIARCSAEEMEREFLAPLRAKVAKGGGFDAYTAPGIA